MSESKKPKVIVLSPKQTSPLTNTHEDAAENPIVIASPKISALPNDYELMSNLPTLNEITIKGALKSSDVFVLSDKAEDYKDADDDDMKEEDSHLIVLTSTGPKKLKAKKFVMSGGGTDSINGFITEEELNEGVEIGTYQFVKIND